MSHNNQCASDTVALGAKLVDALWLQLECLVTIDSFGTLSQHTQCFDPDLATTHDCVRCLSSELFQDDCHVTGAAPYLAMNQEQLL